ncbi:barstar family protein [Psychrobacter celer]|uniref:barstar family protein n=1 Tax=Psychrobacter celer TaxID=306572 RepID=UPI003FD0BD91
MSQAIYYVNPDSTEHDNTLQQATVIPIADVLNKHTLLSSLAAVCHFPSYFSHNWDSAWDCLTDSDVTKLVLDLTTVTNITTKDFTMFQRIIEDAYKEFGKPQLWVITPPTDSA